MPDLMAVLAEPNRRRLLELLVEGERSVNELAAHFGVTRSAISQHLGVLAGAGLVQARREGRFRYYRLVPEGMAALRQQLDQFWTGELEQLVNARPKSKGETVSLEKSVLVPLGPDETFALLTEPERLRRWMAVTARVDLRAGGGYRFTVTPGHSASGTFVEVEPGQRLVFTWGWEGETAVPPGASTVTITLEPAAAGTIVRLVHEGLDEEQAASHLEGWTHFLGRLEQAAAAGDAGPDQWAAAPDPLDELSAAEASLALCQSVLRGIDDAHGSASTPCAKFSVDEVIEHLVGSVTNLGTAAGAPAGATADATASREQRVAGAAQVTLEAWRRRGIDGSVSIGPRELPAAFAAAILSLEFLVHAWDLARATGQRVEVDEALGEYVLGVARQMIQPAARDGDWFAAEVEVGPDADVLDRLAAFTGRAT